MKNGMNTEFKVKLTPEGEKTVHTESLPNPFQVYEYLVVE